MNLGNADIKTQYTERKCILCSGEEETFGVKIQIG